MGRNTKKAIIYRRFKESPGNTLFCYNDFSEYGSTETIRKIFYQACLEGLIKQHCHGIYVKPMQSRFGEVPPSLESIAFAIAERDCARIMPTGGMAANILGISTQVQMQVAFLTTGTSRKVPVGKSFIHFRHAAPKNFAYKGKTMPLIVQAFREIGKQNVNDDVISAVSSYIQRAKDRDVLIEDIQLAPVWIQTILKPIIKLYSNETLATV